MNSHSQPDTWIGRSIGDRQRYRLDKRLAGGGIGDVFLAMDTLLGQQVALKLLKDTLVTSGELRKRFEREVAVCAALKSDHIVEVSDYGVTPEGYPFYVMEYLRGQSLGQLLRQQNRLDLSRTVSIISQVCAGLHLAHQGVTLWRDGAKLREHVKVIHRDLKPDNIFLVPTALGELVKILDFGIAKIRNDTAEHTNLTNMFVGTFHYAAPEQLRVAKNLDERADIYSLGMILYEMLSGTDPFGFAIKAPSTTEAFWALAHTNMLPTPLRSQPDCEQLSPELEAVVMRCLQKAANHRFASVDELYQALQAADRSGMSGTDIPRSLNRSGQGSEESTVIRPLAPPGQRVPDATIFQTAPPRHGDGDKNIPRPLTRSELGMPDATIAQSLPSPGQAVPDATTAQVPPRSPSPGQGVPDATIAQISPPAGQGVSDATIAQIPPAPMPRVSDATTAQIRPLRGQAVPEVTIFQTPAPSGQASRSFSSRFLLYLGAGIAIGLTVIGGIYVYFSHPSKTQFLDEIKNSETQEKL